MKKLNRILDEFPFCRLDVRRCQKQAYKGLRVPRFDLPLAFPDVGRSMSGIFEPNFLICSLLKREPNHTYPA